MKLCIDAGHDVQIQAHERTLETMSRQIRLSTGESVVYTARNTGDAHGLGGLPPSLFVARAEIGTLYSTHGT